MCALKLLWDFGRERIVKRFNTFSNMIYSLYWRRAEVIMLVQVISILSTSCNYLTEYIIKISDDSPFFILNIWSGKHWMFVQQKESTLSRILLIIHENIYYFRLANWRNTSKNWVRLVITCSSMHNNQSQESSRKKWIGISRQH